MVKNIVKLLTIFVLALPAMPSFAIAPGAGQAQIRNNMQEMQKNQQQFDQIQQNDQQKQQIQLNRQQKNQQIQQQRENNNH